jgi:hypothetical protein
MAMQFVGNQIKAGEINQAHHARFAGHVSHVSYSHMRGDQLNSPPGGETAGDTFIVGTVPAGAWVGFSTGNIVQTKVDNPNQASDWQLLDAAMTTGRKLIVNATGLSGSFAGHANAIAEKTGAGLSDYTFLAMGSDYDGQQAVQIGADDDVFANVTHMWNNVASAWATISDVTEIADTDNALEYDQGKLTHRTILGHSWCNTYNRGLVVGSADAEPTAVIGLAWIVTTGGTWDGLSVSVNDIILCKNTVQTLKFKKIGTRVAGDLFPVPLAGLAVGEFVGKEDKIAEWVSGTTYTLYTPHRGDIFITGETEENQSWNMWDGDTFKFDGLHWGSLAKNAEEMGGSALLWNENTRKLDVTLGTDGGIVNSGGLRVSPTASGTPIGQDLGGGVLNYVADRKFVTDIAAYGVKWKNPALILQATDDSDQSGVDPDPTLHTGEAWIVDNWATGTDGDLVESDGTQWNVILAGSGGEPVNGTRVLVTGTSAAGSFATKENQIATYSTTTHAWSFETPDDGDAILISGEQSIYENKGYVFDTNQWIQMLGPGLYTAGKGIYLRNNKIESSLMDEVETLGLNPPNTWTSSYDPGDTGASYYRRLFRNGQLLSEVGGAPGSGEYNWEDSTYTATFANGYLAEGDVIRFIAAPEFGF